MIDRCPLCAAREIVAEPETGVWVCGECDHEWWVPGDPALRGVSADSGASPALGGVSADSGVQVTGHRLRDYDHAVTVLAEARTSRGMSLGDVTQHTGGSRGALSEALRGKHDLGGRRLFDVVAALGYDLVLVSRGTGGE